MKTVAKIPAIAIGAETADKLEKALLKRQLIEAVLNSNCGMNGQKLTHSVIGEITGNKDKKRNRSWRTSRFLGRRRRRS